MSQADLQTIDDFGAQWRRYPENDGYYASLELFADICGPLLRFEELAGARVAEIGSGSGRIVQMLLQAGAGRVLAIEPSQAFEVLKRNTADAVDRIDYLQATGDAIPAEAGLDFVLSIGVLHHIEDPNPVVRAALRALRPGGRILIWLYGREGNEAYLRFVEPLRRVTVHLPAPLLAALSHLLNGALGLYIALCRRFPLPLRGYMTEVIGKFSRGKRFLVIYDQLNPRIAKYYSQAEARALLEDNGFADVHLHHRHGYSWTVTGTRPFDAPAAAG